MEQVAKPRKSVIRRQRKEADKLAKKTGPVVVKLKNVPTSERKMRLVADLIRGKEVNQALSLLKFQPKQGGARLEKLLVSAMADWESKRGKIDESEIVVKDIFVDGGKILKRLRPAPQGRAHRIRKRSNHVTMILQNSGLGVNLINDLVTSDTTTAAVPVATPTKSAPKPKKDKLQKDSKS